MRVLKGLKSEEVKDLERTLEAEGLGACIVLSDVHGAILTDYFAEKKSPILFVDGKTVWPGDEKRLLGILEATDEEIGLLREEGYRISDLRQTTLVQFLTDALG